MDPTTQTQATLDTLTARLAELEAAHTQQHGRIAALERDNERLLRPVARVARFGRRRVAAASPTPEARTSRRGVLGAAAKVAVATAAAGVLAEQVGTRTAFADTYGNFSSSVSGTPAVVSSGTNGAEALNASSDSGFAIAAYSTTGSAIYASGGGGVGVQGAGTNRGVIGTTGTISGLGLYGANNSNDSASVAVLGHSDDGSFGGGLGPGIGVQGETAGGFGVYGTATTGTGVSGNSTSSNGMFGSTDGTTASGVFGGNYGNSASGIGVTGHSDNGSGGLGPGIGVFGETASGTGVYGTAASGIGVYGTSAGGASKQALQGVGTSGAAGLRASSDTGNGIVATSTSGTGLNVQSASGSAVVATSSGVGYGLYLTAPSGWAIGCVGRVRVIGAAVGTVTLAHGTISKTVSSGACSGSSQVILTPTSNPQVSIWAVAAPGAFTIHASSAPSADVTFSYFLIN